MGSLDLEIEYRLLDKLDIDKVMLIENQCYPFPWSKQVMLDCLDSGFVPLAIIINKEISGYIVLSYGAQESHVLNLCIATKYQGKKLGLKLLAEGLKQVKTQQQVKDVYLEVRASNTIAIALYFEFGFNEIGCRKGYYPSNIGREDAIIMAKAL